MLPPELIVQFGDPTTGSMVTPPPPAIAETAASGNSASAPKTPAPSNNVVERKGEAAPLFDYTHLGAKGAEFFGSMVADELIEVAPELKPYFLSRKTS